MQITLQVDGKEQNFMMAVHEEASPTLAVGGTVLAWLQAAGWKEEKSGSDGDGMPMAQKGKDILVVGEDDWDPGMPTAEEMEEDEAQWDRLVDQHQRAAVGGEEPGNLDTGEECIPQHGALSDLLGVSWSELMASGGQDRQQLPSGPKITGPGDNPAEFMGAKKKFEPGKLHNPEHVKEWQSMVPPCDSEVLHWVQNSYTLEEVEAATGLECLNGKVARQNEEALSAIMVKRLRENSWEGASKVVNVMPLNLVDKPTADPPFRLVVNGIPMNEHYNTWRIRYEGVKTVPLAVTRGCWLFSIDLESGYDALLLAPRSRKLFGAKFWMARETFDELVAEGILTEEHVLRAKKGKVEVLVQARTLVQGWTNSCAVFTKLTNQCVKVWRQKGYNLVHILDDFLFAVEGTFEEACAVRDDVIADVSKWGFCLNFKKNVLLPNKCQEFLGVVVDSEKMRFFMPGHKIEKVEALIQGYVDNPTKASYRAMARIAGKILSMSVAISCARLFTRETYRCIRPEGDWDAEGEISGEMLEELVQALQWLRVFNQRGAPIRRRAKATGIRLMMDASVHGFGYRIDGKVRDVEWRPTSYAVAATWPADVYEAQAHRELAAFCEMVEHPLESRKLRGMQILLWTDSVATKAYINNGSGPSTVMSRLMKRIFARCINLGIGVWAEHVAGDILVAAGVDAMSRSTEFTLSHKCFMQLHTSENFGKRGGFKGFTVDACAHEKNHRVDKYFSRDGVGTGSLGDIRTVAMHAREHYYVCPPMGLVEKVLARIEESKVAAVVVVPNWTGSPWHAWLSREARAVQRLPWRGYPATWIDVTEKKVKPHAWAQQWEFVAFALDFRPQHAEEPRGVTPPLRIQRDDTPRHRVPFAGKKGLERKAYPANKQWQRRGVLRVLSLCGGMGTVGWALLRVIELLNLDLRVEVIEVEWDEVARAMAQHMAKEVTTHAKPHDLWEWVVNEKRAKYWLSGLGAIDAVVVGFACQDLSTAHKQGAGLKGDRSGVYFAARQLLQWVADLYQGVSFLFECTVFKKRHPRDWAFVTHSLGVQPTVVDAGWVAPCWRKRAFWANFEMLDLHHRETRAFEKGWLEEGRRPAPRWMDHLPTIMASGPCSWNQKRCVETRTADGWVTGPLRIGEVEKLMGFKEGATAGAKLGEDLLTERQRWKCLGNAIHASVMMHWMVSLIVTKGYITRDDPRLKGQIWTVNQDGPMSRYQAAMQGGSRARKYVQALGPPYLRTAEAAELAVSESDEDFEQLSESEDESANTDGSVDLTLSQESGEELAGVSPHGLEQHLVSRVQQRGGHYVFGGEAFADFEKRCAQADESERRQRVEPEPAPQISTEISSQVKEAAELLVRIQAGEVVTAAPAAVTVRPKPKMAHKPKVRGGWAAPLPPKDTDSSDDFEPVQPRPSRLKRQRTLSPDEEARGVCHRSNDMGDGPPPSRSLMDVRKQGTTQQKDRVPQRRQATTKQSGAQLAMQLAEGQQPLRGSGLTAGDMYTCLDERGAPQLRHMVRQAGVDKPKQPEGVEFWDFVEEVARDLMVMSRAENTWRQYATWWGVFQEWMTVLKVPQEPRPPLEVLQRVMYLSLTLMWYGADYAAKTLELYLSAVAQRVRDEGLGELRDNVPLQRIMEGIRRKKGCAVIKKLPLEGDHIAALRAMEAPAPNGTAWTGKQAKAQWEQLFTAMVVGWGAYLRCREILELQLCDLTWYPDSVELLIRQTKADQRGMTATTVLEAAPPGTAICMLQCFREYMIRVHGGLERKPGCTRGKHKGYRCPCCPPVFPFISAKRVEVQRPMRDRLLRMRMKGALVRLEEAGVLEPGTAERMSVISLRKGGTSTSALYGIREAVREKHGRWGATAAARRSGTSEPEYNMALSGEQQAVSVALHRALNGDKRAVGSDTDLSRGKLKRKKSMAQCRKQ